MTDDQQPVYKIGWIIPDQVVALTHYTPTVSMDDFQHISADAAALIAGATGEFHVLIDNRKIANTEPTPLAMMQQVAPYMNHANLRWVVVIVPEAIKGTAADLPVEQADDVRLKHVDSLDDAIDHLRQVDKNLRWTMMDTEFFG